MPTPPEFPYRIDVLWSDEDRVYVAQVPALGAFGHGPTEDEAVEQARRAARLVLESLTASMARVLRGMGRMAKAVAQTLRDAGVQGDPGSCSECPVAVYLSEVLHVPVCVGPLQDGVFGGLLHAYTDRWPGERVRLPRAVVDFVERFDEGDFEDLCVGYNEP